MEKKLEKIFATYHYVGSYELFFKTGAFVEGLMERYDTEKPCWFESAGELLGLIRKAALSRPQDLDDTVKELEGLRSGTESEMKKLVELRDNLSVCGYVLKRLSEPEPKKAMDDEKEASALISLIFRTSDSAAVREGVSAAVASLPLRIAKQRFFDIIENALETQLGRTEKDIDDTVSNIEGYGGLKVIGVDGEADNEAAEVVGRVFGSDLTGLPADELLSLKGKCDEAVLRTSLMIDALSDMGLMINAALLELASFKYLEQDGMTVYGNERITSRIVRIVDAFEAGDRTAFDEGALYEGIDEGELERLEDLRLKIPGMEDGFLAMSENVSPDVFRDAKRCVTLISDSIFGSLSENEEESPTVDTEMITRKAGELRERLLSSFGQGSKLLQRARMAGILSRLPLFLKTSEEVRDYVRSSLSSCRDEKEKAVAVRELKEFFSDII